MLQSDPRSGDARKDATGAPSLGELFSSLARDMSTLVRQEVALAKTELTQNAARAGKGAAAIAVGGLLAFFGAGALVAALILLLAIKLASWLAALIVGLALCGIGGVLAMGAIAKLKKGGLAPRQTVETLKEDSQWMKEQMK